ncbi:MAG: class I tRNA ligase family protein [Patescibacteria group bacterium]|jgi:isoleucyl-tRNA synthetase
MAKFHLPSIEEEQLKKWDEKDVFRQVLNKPDQGKSFVFFEGPPTANGKPGIHHVLARSFKDVILRFRTMQGHKIDRKAGWDTHGLPVELEVEKQLGFTQKKQIEEFGIANFNAKCKESVWKYLDIWQQMTKRIAFWVDLEHPYITYTNDYIESLWSIIKEIDRKGLLYQGYRVTPHCPRCVTSLSSHELAQGYKDVDDQSVYVKFPIDAAAKRYFLVWTTTPWTLPGNDALAVGAAVTYAEVKMKATGETYILAKDRLVSLDGEYDILSEKTGEQLVGIAYQPLYDTAKAFTAAAESSRLANAYKVYAAGFVSTTDGTGIVHIAPAFGEDDARLGEAAKLPTLLTVDSTGMMLAEAPGKGRFIKKADEDVKADLTARGLLYKSETYRHAYPFCWRCGTPLLYYAKNSWYIRMSELREKLQQHNQAINWVPDHIRDGRFGEWLREVKDWALSRERYWGTPLPIWRCESCQERLTIGGMEEMKKLARPGNTYYLQRHGEAENNVANVVSSYPELKEWHLTAQGREQVQVAAKELKQHGIDLIFASDLLRTKETAEIIAAELGLPVVYDPRLRELGVGEANGKTIAEFHAQFASKLERFDKPAVGGENLRDCRRRLVAFVKELEAKYSGQRILIVSHGDPIWMLDSGFGGASDEETLTWRYNAVGAFSEFRPDGLPRDDQGRIDLHRPYVDEAALACPKCSGAMKRSTEVLDCWFDSGAMPFAQWHYPFENAERIDQGRNFPADYISEAIDQTRGWFYTLLAVSTLLDKPTPPYKNVICLGHVLDAKGQKMSKSKGNVVDPWLMISKYGADAIRYHFFTVNQPGEPKCFDEKSLDEVTKKVFLILWNVLTFWQMYAGEKARATDASPASQNELDRWILAELAELGSQLTGRLESYQVVDACRSLGDFINSLSTWYLRRSRDRFKGEPTERQAAVETLGYVLLTLSRLMAPFTPFLAEALYAEVGGPLASVHLDAWPTLKSLEDATLRTKMEFVRQAASLGLEKRAVAGIPVRQALAKATVRSVQVFDQWMKEIVAVELNVEAVESEVIKEAKDAAVELDTNITPELRRKGAVRELVRNINDLRKTAGLTVHDRIVLNWNATGEFWPQVFAEHRESLLKDVLAADIAVGSSGELGNRELEVAGEKVWLGINKV